MKANNSTKNNAIPSIKVKPLTEGQQFFKKTVALAIETLDIPRFQALAFTRKHSVTKLARVTTVANALTMKKEKIDDANHDPLKMVKVMVKSNRPFDHVRNWFSPKQIDNLRGPRAILDAAELYLKIRQEAEEYKAKAQLSKNAA